MKQCNQFLEAVSEIYEKNHSIACWVQVYMLLLLFTLLMNYAVNN